MGVRAGIVPITRGSVVEAAVDEAVRPYRDALRAVLNICVQADEGLLSNREARDRIARAALQQLGGRPR